MIAPELKGLLPHEMKGPIQAYIRQNHGNDLWVRLKPFIMELEKIRKELGNVHSLESDIEKLKRYQDLYARNYCYSMGLNKYLAFG